jgi:hypothetical protein
MHGKVKAKILAWRTNSRKKLGLPTSDRRWIGSYLPAGCEGQRRPEYKTKASDSRYKLFYLP